MSNEVLIGEFEKNAAEVVRAELMRLTVGLYVDIRIWSTPRPGDSPGLHRTDRGFMLAAKLLPEFRKLVDQAIATVKIAEDGGKAEQEIAQEEAAKE
jgi:hypothetical protein